MFIKLKQSSGTFGIQTICEDDVKKCVVTLHTSRGAWRNATVKGHAWGARALEECLSATMRNLAHAFPQTRGVQPSSSKGNVVFRFLLPGTVLLALITPMAASAEPWFTVLGDPAEKNGELIEVLPAPTSLGERVLLDLRVSRSHQRTSFRGQKYRSYEAKISVDCTAQKAWYLWLSYHAEPQWQGPEIAKENYEEGQAPVLFKDVPGQPYKRLIKAACKARPGAY